MELMNKEIISMVQCPYCNNWIKDDDATCEECIPLANTDIALHSLQESISTLKLIRNMDKKRLDWLSKSINELISVRKTLQENI